MGIGFLRQPLLLVVAAAALVACGGGNGLGPKAIQQQEDKVWDRLPLSWAFYNAGQFAAAIDAFSTTLSHADQLEGSAAVRSRIKAEAYDGVGWCYFRQQQLDSAAGAFRQATGLDGQNTDAWVGSAGVALAQRRYSDVAQYCIQALESNADYSSAFRTDNAERNLAHDRYDDRHVRLMLAEAYLQLGRYSVAERPDPNNAAAQVRLIQSDYRYRDPGHLVQVISGIALGLQQEATE